MPNSSWRTGRPFWTPKLDRTIGWDLETFAHTIVGRPRSWTTEKRGPKKRGRHQWHQIRNGKHIGRIICLRRGCGAIKRDSFSGKATCPSRPL